MADYDERLRLLNERINQLEDELKRFEANTGFMSAETMLEKAKAWITRNPKAWAYLTRRAAHAINNQERFSIKRELENMREADLNIGDDDYKISNSYSPVFVRILIQELPDLRELVTLRHSKVDRYFR